jgi:class 3 adenylate cyclase
MKTSAVWQRKTLTVLHTDVCGSTRLSREMELESYGELFVQVAAIWSKAARLHGVASSGLRTRPLYDRRTIHDRRES